MWGKDKMQTFGESKELPLVHPKTAKNRGAHTHGPNGRTKPTQKDGGSLLLDVINSKKTSRLVVWRWRLGRRDGKGVSMGGGAGGTKSGRQRSLGGRFDI